VETVDLAHKAATTFDAAGMTTVQTSEEVQDQRVLSMHHHIQRVITYQLRALYPPIEELSPALRAKLAEMDDFTTSQWHPSAVFLPQSGET
jgi:hypothetical protein